MSRDHQHLEISENTKEWKKRTTKKERDDSHDFMNRWKVIDKFDMWPGLIFLHPAFTRYMAWMNGQ